MCQTREELSVKSYHHRDKRDFKLYEIKTSKKEVGHDQLTPEGFSGYPRIQPQQAYGRQEKIYSMCH